MTKRRVLNVGLFIALLLCLLILFSQNRLLIFAEQSGGTPNNDPTTSRLKTAYDWLVIKGTNYGVTDAVEWTENWGTMWNRVMEAAAWEPDGTATTGEVPSSLTFYAGDNNRTKQTGTLFENQALMDYDDYNCSANNAEASGSACAASDSETTAEESTWTKTSAGTPYASVTDNAVTVTITSNTVYKDSRSGLYWSDINAGGDIIDNEFIYIDGNDRTNPSGNSCNFNAAGNANAYCDQYGGGDNDVSAAEFCLNLSLDSNGDGTAETDWRLPSQKELMQAYIDGAANSLPNPAVYTWSSTEYYSNPAYAWGTNLHNGTTNGYTKSTSYRVRCVRRG